MDDQAPTAISDVSLRALLVDRLAATHVEVEDVSGGCGQSFHAVVVSPQFQSLNSLKRHRLVNGALKEEISRIHAWTVQCRTPEEWKAERGKEESREESKEECKEESKEERTEES